VFLEDDICEVLTELPPGGYLIGQHLFILPPIVSVSDTTVQPVVSGIKAQSGCH